MKKIWSKAATVLALSLYAMTAQAAAPVNLISNGDFETGSFAGWTVVNTGGCAPAWAVNDGTFVPLGPGGPLPPINGSFDAVSSQCGSAFHALRQYVTVPSSGIFSARISWNDRLRNHYVLYHDPLQEWRVVIRDTGGTQLYEIYSTTPGDPLIQIGPNSRAADVTAIFQSLAGQTVMISFEEDVNLYFFNATLDDVKLFIAVLPKDKDECKNGGWQTFVNLNTGQMIFKNQGDCVSFVATKGKNPPASF